MSRFLYYVPGCGASISSDKLSEIGLSDRITSPACRPCRGQTPDKGSGAVVVQTDSDSPNPIMDMGNQSWHPAPKGSLDSPPFWVGYASADPPGPESLQRDALHRGETMLLEGGGRWHVPVLRNFFEGDDEVPVFFQPSLPQMVGIDENGNAISGDIVPKYRDLWEQALDIHKRLYAQALMQGDGMLTTSELFSFAAKCIGVNYRVSLLELASIDAMSTSDCTAIVRSALDLDNYENIVGNYSSRSIPQDTDSYSGADRQTADSPTQLDTSQASGN